MNFELISFANADELAARAASAHCTITFVTIK
jgi:hypothetical protein